MKSTRKLVCLNNIPTPYRLYFFRLLYEELTRRGWIFEAWFMAKSEPGRYWQFASEDFLFPNRFFPGVSPHSSGVSFHLNPQVYSELRTHPPEILISGGAWVMPTTILSSFAPQSTLKVFWSESHFLSLSRSSGVASRLRTLLMGKYDAFAVPGKLARSYVEHFVPGKPLVTLPNLVDPDVYDNEVHRLRNERSALREKYAIRESQRVLLVPARLNPAKGIVPFLNALASEFRHSNASLTVLIAGDGQLRAEIERWSLQSASPSVVLLGHQTQPAMCELYAIADGVALPSYSDPNPLSVVEALWAGLPLLLSDRVGNHYETLTPASNGWLFSTDDMPSVCKAVESWLALSKEDLEKYGAASYAVARRSFEPQGVVSKFLDEIIGLSQQRSSYETAGNRTSA